MFKIPELLKATRGKLVSGGDKAIVKGISIDSRTIKKGEAFIAIKGNNFDGHLFIAEALRKGACCVITQKEAQKHGPAFIRVKDTRKALGDIAYFHRRRFKLPLIAVTGSNGKTTTKDMIYSVLSKKFKVLKNEGTKNNQIGLALTLLKLDSSYDTAVLEIGTSHFGETKYLSSIARANIGVITNIGPSHLEYFKDLKGVFKEKYNLINSLDQPAIAVLNADDNFLRKKVLEKKRSPFVLGVGIKKKSDFFAYGINNTSGRFSFEVNQRFKFALNLLGYYNIYNSLLAIAVGRIFGLEYRDIAASLSGFVSPKGRLSLIEIKGIRFIDDTYNANPLSMEQALGALASFPKGGRKILVMGDMLELGKVGASLHLKPITNALKFCDALITVGEQTRSCLDKVTRFKKSIIACETPSQARVALFKKIGVKPGDIVLVKGSRGMKMEEVFKV